jgi:hypothetical protein
VNCGHINKNQIVTKPPITISETQFDCGPKEPPLPSDEELKKWTSDTLFKKYTDAWLWGERCDKLLNKNKVYFEKALENRDPKIPAK